MNQREYTLSLCVSPYLFVGTKPIAVIFGDERVDVKSWRGVYAAVMKCCNDTPEHHEMLMYLRNKTAGKVRVVLSDRPDGMTRPYKIDTDLYGEIHYGSETLMHIMCQRILKPARFDYSDIRIALKRK